MKALSMLMQSHGAKRWISMLLCIALVLALTASAFADVTAREKGSSSSTSGSGLQSGAIPIKKASASSQLIENYKGSQIIYKASNAVDGKINTAWIEGANGAGAGGREEAGGLRAQPGRERRVPGERRGSDSVFGQIRSSEG